MKSGNELLLKATSPSRILKKNKLPDRTIFRCREVLDNTVSVIKNALSACLIDKDRMVVGTEDGLFCVDLDRDGKFY